jgi:hypothetical protein
MVAAFPVFPHDARIVQQGRQPEHKGTPPSVCRIFRHRASTRSTWDMSWLLGSLSSISATKRRVF